ncbi:hypothetical protein PFLUV_G00261530 [Perca fluviatilis]|uniref:Uncharacterized protein n=1 Tax=Perca fluviatilis TaxID=8168 RepID=A0A6A5DN99_PERFL|nr:hypothetical protein PFLUV_G00261530 [Perca fluviatilis]
MSRPTLPLIRLPFYFSTYRNQSHFMPKPNQSKQRKERVVANQRQSRAGNVFALLGKQRAAPWRLLHPRHSLIYCLWSFHASYIYWKPPYILSMEAPLYTVYGSPLIYCLWKPPYILSMEAPPSSPRSLPVTLNQHPPGLSSRLRCSRTFITFKNNTSVVFPSLNMPQVNSCLKWLLAVFNVIFAMRCCGLFSYEDWEGNIPDSCLCSTLEEMEGKCQTVDHRQQKSVYIQACFSKIISRTLLVFDIVMEIFFTLIVLGACFPIISSRILQLYDSAIRT